MPVSLMKFFSGEEQNLQSWDYYSQVLDYQGFQIIGPQFEGIVL
jgi:hypothetical protein